MKLLDFALENSPDNGKRECVLRKLLSVLARTLYASHLSHLFLFSRQNQYLYKTLVLKEKLLRDKNVPLCVLKDVKQDCA